MKYVVDSSAALKWVLPEIDSDKAIRLREEYRNGLHDLLAVDIFPAEAGNGLLVAERMGRIASFANLLADILTTCPRLQSTIPLIPAATMVISKVRVSLYDALYIALAEVEQCDMVTGDKRLVNNVRRQFPFVRDMSTLP